MQTPLRRALTLAWSRLRSPLLALTVALAWIGPGVARAQLATDRATAEVLFNEALALLGNQRVAEACRKLEESQRLDPGLGTLLYLADCYEQEGRTASAWATFKEAAYVAKDHGDEREAVALEHARELEPKLSYLAVDVSDVATAGLQIAHDGKPLGQPLWGTAFPVDPGSHTLAATAPGKKPWSLTLDVPEGPHQERVSIPVLDDAAPEPAPAPPPPMLAVPREPEAAPGSTQRVAGWVLLGVGSAAVITGGVFALLARGDDADADRECRPDLANLCNRAGVDLADSAKTKATLAGISAGVGLAALGAGVTLLLTAPRGPGDASSGLALHATPVAGGGEMSFSARW